MAADQTVPEGVVVEVVVILGVPVVADLTPVGVVVDRTTMARNSPIRLELTAAPVTSLLSFLTSDRDFLKLNFANSSSKRSFY